MQKKVSIIIPVYNGEKHLARCIDSVLGQSGFDSNDLEIMLINDGSSDSSPQLIDEYARKYDGVIRAVHQTNRGVASTRNRGILEAKGIYCVFIDQDDWIEPEYIAKFYNEAESQRLDVVCGGYRRPDETGHIREIRQPSNTDYGKYIVMAAWAKIHRTEFLRANNIEFFKNKYGEDSVFTVGEINRGARWGTIKYVGYNWFYNERSVSNTSQRGLTGDNTSALILLLNELIRTGGDIRNNFLFRYFLLRTIVFYVLFSGKSSSRDEFTQSQNKLFHWFDIHAGSSDGFRYVFGPHGERLVVRAIIGTIFVLRRTRLLGVFARLYCRG